MPDDSASTQSVEPQSTTTTLMSGGVNFDAGRDVTIGGDVVGRDKIVQNIQQIYERALSAVEEADRAKAIEAKCLAQGVSALAQRLKARVGGSLTVNTGNPYRGLLEYGLSDVEIFVGRERAIHDLLGHLHSGLLTVLYSESGAGKTSLLQAGIAPRLIGQGHLPLYVRSYDADPALKIKREILSDPGQAPLLMTAPLRDFLRQVSGVLGAQSTLHLMLDQFEEFFTRLDEAPRAEFIGELAECLDDASLNVHWVLALRSEYFGNLGNFRPRIRNPFENDYLLKRLTRAEAREVVSKPIGARSRRFEDGLIDQLLDDLGKTDIAPPQIQLVCATLYEELAPEDETITRARYEREGGAAGILRGHLERVLSRQIAVEQRAAARRLLESLISSEQQRVMRTLTQLIDELAARGVTPHTLDVILNQLIDSRLLKVDETDDGPAYELAHDYLLSEIKLDPDVQARKAAQELVEQEVRAYRRYKTLLSADRLQVIEPYIADLRLTPEAEQLLNDSRAARQRDRDAEKARIQEKLDTANRLAEAEKQRAEAEGARASEARARVVEVEAERDRAERQSRLARSRELAAIALNQINVEPERGLLIAIEATKSGDTFEAQDALRKLLLVSLARCESPRYEHWINSAQFSPDGRLIVTTSSDQTARIRDAATGKELAVLHGHVATVTSAQFSPDGQLIVTASWDQTARVWDVATGRERVALREHEGKVTSAQFSPDSQQIITASSDQTARVWNAATGKRAAVLRGHEHWINRAQFSPDGRLIVTASWDQTARVWDATTGKEQTVLRGHEGKVTDAQFSPDGRQIVTASWDQTVRVWDTAAGKEWAILRGHEGKITSAQFSPNSQHLVTASSDQTAKVWDVASGREKSVLRGHEGKVTSAQFSPDGQQIVTASSDQTARVWDMLTGREQAVLRGHTDSIRSVQFSPAGHQIITVGWDGTARVYLVYLADLIALAKTYVTRELTSEERAQYVSEDVDSKTSA